MQIDPLVEWQRLTETYSKMYDAELLQLAADSGNLTDTAQQVLNDEMRKRGLSLSPSPDPPPRNADLMQERVAATSDVDSGAAELDADAENADGDADAAVDYTWKTVLCECETTDQARQLSVALHKAGIESWVEGQNTSSPFGSKDVRYARVIVPADRLEEAQAIAARPIPKDIVEDLETEIPEYQPPVCPKCGTADPILESADPVNTWFCENCENEWTETAETAAANPESGSFNR